MYARCAEVAAVAYTPALVTGRKARLGGIAVEVPMIDIGRQSPASTRSLSEVIHNRRWTFADLPFPHVLAENVFERETYLDMVTAFRTLFDDGANFHRDMPGFDASGYLLAAALPPPLDIFVSRPWHDLLCGLFDVRGTGHVSGGFHHHEPGGRPGGIHNDLNAGWFPEPGGAGRVRLADPARCSYGRGETSEPGLEPVRAIRAVSLIFYLANPPWRPGDGGETGLFRHQDDDLRHPAVAVPPIANSLIAFEATPWSFHSFLGGSRNVREALVMWTHRAPAEVEARWGKGVVVPWR